MQCGISRREPPPKGEPALDGQEGAWRTPRELEGGKERILDEIEVF
jgi:hypothetical protein